MQFTPWYELYEKYKDEIPNKEEFFRKWQDSHIKFVEEAFVVVVENSENNNEFKKFLDK